MRSIRLLTFLAAVCTLFPTIANPQRTATPQLNHDPDKALISANDVRLFWSAYDLWSTREHGAPEKLAEVLQHEYLDKGSQGLKEFVPGRIRSADYLAKVVLNQRSYYESVRHNTEQMENFIPEIRKYFLRLKKLYPDAAFPAVYFVIGAQNSGGTSSAEALIIGSEMFGNGPNYFVQMSDVVPMVIHESAHFQQKDHSKNDLFNNAMREGGADFVAELVTGRHINEANKPYGDSHEQELWQRLQHDIKSRAEIGNWMGVFNPTNGEPRDLGYYMGYKICQSYYEIHSDKQQALKTIMVMQSPEEILSQSGYGQRFK
ncbi:MAG TPA: DUF2268 domain-containing putative Zn-dependent protease [Candidatus Angelobacter sp.]|nr:DUF2268 domain-containing putative Zn-dependent protease [Candidatus Angelobacter sp.]